MKKLEKVKAVHQGAQSRFELFKARSEETLAHSPQCVHVKKTAQRPSIFITLLITHEWSLVRLPCLAIC